MTGHVSVDDHLGALDADDPAVDAPGSLTGLRELDLDLVVLWVYRPARRNGQQDVPPPDCGRQDPARSTFYCVGADGHRGRHTYRGFGDGVAN